MKQFEFNKLDAFQPFLRHHENGNRLLTSVFGGVDAESGNESAAE